MQWTAIILVVHSYILREPRQQYVVICGESRDNRTREYNVVVLRLAEIN